MKDKVFRLFNPTLTSRKGSNPGNEMAMKYFLVTRSVEREISANFGRMSVNMSRDSFLLKPEDISIIPFHFEKSKNI